MKPFGFVCLFALATLNYAQAIYYQQVAWDHPGLKGFFHFYLQKNNSQLYWVVGTIDRYIPKEMLKTPLYPRISGASAEQIKIANQQIEQEKEALRFHQSRFISKPGKKMEQRWEQLQTHDFTPTKIQTAKNLKAAWEQFFNHSMLDLSLKTNSLQALFLLKPSTQACELLDDWSLQYPEQNPIWFWSGLHLPPACGKLLLKLIKMGANLYWNALPALATTPYDTREYVFLGQKFNLFQWAGGWPLQIPQDVRLFKVAQNLISNQSQRSKPKEHWLKFIQDGTQWQPNSEIKFYFMGHSGNWDGYGESGQIQHQLLYQEREPTSSPTLLKVNFKNEEGASDSHLIIPASILKTNAETNLDQATEQANQFFKLKGEPFITIPPVQMAKVQDDNTPTLIKWWLKYDFNPYLSSQQVLARKIPWSRWFKSNGVPAEELSRLQIERGKLHQPLWDAESMSLLRQPATELAALINLYYQAASTPEPPASTGNLFSTLVDYFYEHPEIKKNRTLYEDARSDLYQPALTLHEGIRKYLTVQKIPQQQKIKAWNFYSEDWRVGDVLSVLEIILLTRPKLAKLVLGEFLCQEEVVQNILDDSLPFWAQKMLTRELWHQKRFPQSGEFKIHWIIQESDLLEYQVPLRLLSELQPQGILYGRNSNSTLAHAFHLLYKIIMYPFEQKNGNNPRFDQFLTQIFMRPKYLPEALNCRELIKQNRNFKPGLTLRAISTHDSNDNPTHLKSAHKSLKENKNRGYTNRVELGHSWSEDLNYMQQDANESLQRQTF